MTRTARRGDLSHPETSQLDLLDVLHALSDPTRVTITCTLRSGGERPCGTFGVDVAPSTLTHHFRILRESGVIRQREDGSRRWNALRRDDLDQRWPGLLDSILDGYENDHDAQARETHAR